MFCFSFWPHINKNHSNSKRQKSNPKQINLTNLEFHQNINLQSYINSHCQIFFAFAKTAWIKMQYVHKWRWKMNIPEIVILRLISGTPKFINTCSYSWPSRPPRLDKTRRTYTSRKTLYLFHSNKRTAILNLLYLMSGLNFNIL